MTAFKRELGEYFKSSRSEQGGNCVEVKHTLSAVVIRDSKYLRDLANDPAAQPVIEILAADWPRFLHNISTGSPAMQDLPTIEHRTDGMTVLRAENGTTLTYTASEWAAFVAGAKDKEFDRPAPAVA